MKIYTRTGDSGETSLIGGQRVKKNDVQIEAYGTVDELNSWIGLIRDQEIADAYKLQLSEIQDRLFTIGSILATSFQGTKMKLPEILQQDIEFLEVNIDEMNDELPEMRSFVLPGGHQTASYTHIARCVCRRSERMVVAMTHVGFENELVLKYLNRLSDYLFVLSRKLIQDVGAAEIPWRPRL